MTWGRYRLDVSDDSGALTQVSFDAGFYAEAGADTPDLLEIALDKPEYRAGDTMNVAVTARSNGRVTLNVVGDRMLSTVTADVKTGINQLAIPVGKDWGNGAYVVGTLRRPLDAAAKRMPGRAIGVQWFFVDKATRTLGMDMTLPQVIRPNTTLRVPVKLTGLTPGEDARIVVAAVDVGILNLTNYKPPAPDEYFLGQRRLSAEVRDLYGQLIDGMQGSRGAIRTGGDDGGGAVEGSPPSQKPLALYSGIVQVKPDGTAEVSFEIPAFAGTARVMGIAWSRGRVGKAVGDVIIRDPVVVTATLPRFLNTGDKSTLHVDLDNVEGQAGDYAVTLAAQGPTGAVGQGRGQGDAARQAATGAVVPARSLGRGRRQNHRQRHRAGRLHARARIRTPCAAGEPVADTTDGAPDREGRKHHALQRSVRRSGTGHRQRRAVGRAVDRARCGGDPEGARSLSVRLLRADHEPGAAASLCQRSGGLCPACARYRRRPAHPRLDRPASGTAGKQWLVRLVVDRR